jgi:hypothetical protein
MTCYRCGDDRPTISVPVDGGEVEACAGCAAEIHDGEPWPSVERNGDAISGEHTGPSEWATRCPNGHLDYYHRVGGLMSDIDGPNYRCNVCGEVFEEPADATVSENEVIP